MHRPFVFFDFDGVIADSFAQGLKTAQKFCVYRTEDVYRASFGENVHDAHARAALEAHGPECNHDMNWWDTFVPLFQDESTLFAGMDNVIKDLSKSYNLAIISSSLASPIQWFLAKHHIDSYFEAVFSTETHKSKREKIRIAFDQFGVGGDACVFLTDTVGDIVEARAEGVPAIAVSWGFQSRETLMKAQPFRVVDAPAEIAAAVAAVFDGAALRA